VRNVKNRSRAARENAGLSVGQVARFLGMSAEAISQIEADDAAYAVADRTRLADVYGVNIEWLDGDREARDYASIDSMNGADQLTFHDRDILAEFAASMPRSAPTTLAAKVRHVKSQGQTRKHACHWPGCDGQVPPAMWGCKMHWFMLPKALRDKIWRAYRPGQERDMTPSAAYLAVADEVQRWIRERPEGA
jgi:transcriptional regulator with XRE-family HTH domain